MADLMVLMVTVTSWMISDMPSSSSSASVVAGGSKERPEPTHWKPVWRRQIEGTAFSKNLANKQDLFSIVKLCFQLEKYCIILANFLAEINSKET